MAAEENFVLVEMTHGRPDPAMNALAPSTKPDIKRVLRVYLSQRRAEEDLALLRETDPTTTYEVLAVEHIDN